VTQRAPFNPQARLFGSSAFEQAVVFHNQQRLWEAERLYKTVLRTDGGHVGALYHFGLLRLQQGRFDDAVRLFRRAVKVDRNCAEAHHHLGVAFMGLGRAEQAIQDFEAALAIRPQFAEAHDSLGQALQALGRYERAIAHHHSALSIKPNYPEALNNLGNALHLSGRSEEAILHYEQALALWPNYAPAHNSLGNALHALGRPEQAIAHYEKALTIRPAYPEAHNNMGRALAALGRFEDAMSHYESALAIRPTYAHAHINLGEALAAVTRYDEAMEHFQKALAVDPKDLQAHECLAKILTSIGQTEQALRQWEKVLAIDPNNVRAHNLRGGALQALGRVDEAIRAFETAIALAPTKTAAYLNLTAARRVIAADPNVTAMEKLAREIDSLGVDDQIGLHFALGKAYADLCDYEQSFRHLQQGNSLNRKQIKYDEPKTLERFIRIQSIFSAELLRKKEGAGYASSMPVFIVGMPRSGTTLVEQVLASHPKVFGAGELDELQNLVASFAASTGSEFPEAVPAMSGAHLHELGAAYVSALQRRAPSADRITDKMPSNFMFAGLIALMLPNARIIHTCRDPRDTALSCFSIRFGAGQEYTYDLTELGRYIRAYQGLMEHWRTVLPPGLMIEVQYENLVGNLEEEARRIAAHCGLDWDDACLRFHKTERSVHTASAIQVRQPIYQSSVGRWRRYEDQLRPLLQALGGG
jgi:tetratricopeptide (TPR) repeat protein